MNCPRHCTGAQHRAILDIMVDEDQRNFFGIAYPDQPGEPVEIHDPNKHKYHSIGADGVIATRDAPTMEPLPEVVPDQEVEYTQEEME